MFRMRIIFGETTANHKALERLWNIESKYIDIVEIHAFCFRKRAFKLETINVTFTELIDFVVLSDFYEIWPNDSTGSPGLCFDNSVKMAASKI